MSMEGWWLMLTPIWAAFWSSEVAEYMCDEGEDEAEDEYGNKSVGGKLGLGFSWDKNNNWSEFAGNSEGDKSMCAGPGPEPEPRLGPPSTADLRLVVFRISPWCCC